MSTFVVSQDCIELGLRAGALILRNVQITRSSPEQRQTIDDLARQVGAQFSTPAEVRGLPELVKLYEILRQVGLRPRSHPPSTQRLLEFALKQGILPSVNNLVDAYNLISVQSKCSLGAHDLDQLRLPVQLRLFCGNERFRPLGGDEETWANRGEFGYIDSSDRVICRLDSEQADFSRVTERTSNVLLIIESTTVHKAQQLERVFADTVAMVTRYCGGIAETAALPY